MPHENIQQSKLSHRELEGFAASPHSDGLSIEEKFADDRQMLQRCSRRVRKLVHNVVELINPPSQTDHPVRSRRRARCGSDPARGPD